MYTGIKTFNRKRENEVLEPVSVSLEKEKHRSFFGIRVSAIVETLIFITLTLILDYLFGTGDRFQSINPHPFWIIVLIVTVQYGTVEGVVASVLCTTALYAGNVPDMQFNESLFQYNARLALNPTLWFVAALVIGEMHMRVISERDKFKEIAIVADRDAREVTDAYQMLKEKKEHLEVRLVSQIRSFSFSIKALQNMESMSSAQIMMSLIDMIREIVGPKKFSVYTFSEMGFEVMLSEGWEGENFQRRFPNQHPLYREIVSRKRLISVVNPEDEVVLEGEGLIAAPIIDRDSGTIFGMLKIEDIEFYDLNISNLWVIESLAELVGSAFLNAQKYDQLTKATIFASSQEGVYSYPFYRMQKPLLSKVLGESNNPFTELDVIFDTDQDVMKKIRPDVEYFLSRDLPAAASIYQMGRDELHYVILLPNYSLKKAQELNQEYNKILGQEDKLKDCKWTIEARNVKYAQADYKS